MLTSHVLRACAASFALAASAVPLVRGASAPLGAFTGQTDIGTVAVPTKATFDAATGIYTIGASGANMWLAEDDFGFVWKQASGDVALAADIELVGEAKEGHRKGLLMIRQSLDADAPYVDVAVHGDGLTSLQFRSDKGGVTREIRCPIKAPRRVRLEKRGAYVSVSIAGPDGVLSESGCVMRLSFDGPYYLGIGVCAHDKESFETARFSSVELGAPPALSKSISALETVPLASLDRSVVYRAAGRMETPVFTPKNDALIFSRDGRIQRLALDAGATPTQIDTARETHCNNNHGVSPDGARLVITDLGATQKPRLYTLPIGGGDPSLVPVEAPAYWHSWSPDGSLLAYCAGRGDNYDIYTVPLAGGAETRLTTSPGNDSGPDYTPDGNWIYFHSDRSGSFQIWRMRADGSEQTQITNDAFENWFPHPSPDGKWVVFLSTMTRHKVGHPPDSDCLLRLIPNAGDAAPKEIVRFYGGNGSLNVPCWSHDSTHITYAVYSPFPVTAH